MRFLPLLIIVLITHTFFAQVDGEKKFELSTILGKDSLVDRVFSNADNYRLQWIYTPLEMDNSGNFHPIETYDFSTGDYFYPASMVKLPTALLSFEKLHRLGVPTSAILHINRDQVCGNMAYIDRLENSAFSFRDIVEEMISISDNDLYNALYHFLTPQLINDELLAKGIHTTKIYKSFTGCEMADHLFSNSLVYFDTINQLIHFQESSRMDLDSFTERYSFSEEKLIGAKHESRGKIVDGPFDFNSNLEYPLKDIHGTMERLFYPKQFKPSERWNLRPSDRDFLLKTLVQYPREMRDEKYHDLKKYPDNYYKYIVHGDGNPDFKEVKTYSKIGISYGFVTETALVVDEKNGKAYLLSVSMYVNANDTVNDGKYEYEEVARPFLAKLGQLLLAY